MGEILRQYGRLCLYFVALVGWIAAVPAYGPVGNQWATAHALSEVPVALWFVFALAPSLVLTGRLWERSPHWITWGLKGSVSANIALTMALAFLPVPSWPIWYVAMGIASAFGVTAWVRVVRHSVEMIHLGRLLAVAAAGVAGVVWLCALSIQYTSADFALGFSELVLATALWTVRYLPGTCATLPPSQAPAKAELNKGDLARIGIIAGCLALMGGVSHFLITTPDVSTLETVLCGGAFVGGAVFSGVMADRGRLQSGLVVGAGLLAVSALVEATGTERMLDIIGDSLTCAALGFAEPIPWLLFANKSTPASSGRWYGWGLNLYVVRIVITLLSTIFLHQIPEQQIHLIGAVAALFSALCFFGVTEDAPFLGRLGNPKTEPPPPADLKSVQSPVTAPAADLLEGYFGDKLSSREVEIGRLAVVGTSTREIAEQLFLSENTVKTHLKSVYRKTESTNRNDLYRKLIRLSLQDQPTMGIPPALRTGEAE